MKCFQCPNRRFLQVTDETIRWHLSGLDEHGRDFVMGVYPMLLDESCFFLAVDFDKAKWMEDAQTFLKTCRDMGVPAALERSRSGNGGHVWLFFDEAVPAVLARKLGAHLLTETIERHPDVGLDSYDRLFPNQDTLPSGGFGNLIALPLQKIPREQENSVFLDGRFAPREDQWAFLSGMAKISRGQAEAIAREAESKGRVVGVRMASSEEDDAEPWTLPPSRQRKEPAIAGPLPKRVELVLSNEIYIPTKGLPPGLRSRLVRLAAFQNPEFYKAQAMRLPTYGKPRVIGCAEEHSKHIGLPRGCLDEIVALLSGLRVEPVVRDERFAGEPFNATFRGTLRPEQEPAAAALLAHDTGVLAAPTAFGKTALAAWLIARRGVNALVLVHRRQLLEQWVERLIQFLDVPGERIGRVGGGRKRPTGSLDVALVQSLVRKGVVNDLVGAYGHLIVDECHHLSAHSFERVARRAKAKFVTGLSATVTRKDGHHPIILMQCGPIRHRADARKQAAQRPFTHAVIVRPTAFRGLDAPDDDARVQFQKLYGDLMANEKRNQLICADVVEAVREGRSPLILTERNEHLDLLAGRLEDRIRHLVVMRGGMGKRQLAAVSHRLATIPADEDRAILATGRYIGEGFDDARLDTLFLALPVSWRGTIAQYAGRLHRLYDRKREVRVYDYADLNVPMLARMFDRRCRGYEAVGYSIRLPASAVPGWPEDAPLPVDPRWKRDYAASVQRLIRDGVDQPLANLFAHVAREVTDETEGVDRARSASEAFLYRRLETLPVTAGRFRLNADLPIPFNGRGAMEVDLFCADARLVIELDGGQHLEDAERYRRDRKKDYLLQENGYLVLRFLAEDLGKRLDEVLDEILRALAHRKVEDSGCRRPAEG
jgi:superfamily II DNA or RNA helicase/very-short-patch-repair endonuclease